MSRWTDEVRDDIEGFLKGIFIVASYIIMALIFFWIFGVGIMRLG